MRIDSIEAAKAACARLHEMGPAVVVLSSVSFVDASSHITLLCSVAGRGIYQIRAPRLPMSFTGTGDLFSALLLTWYVSSGGDAVRACEHAFASLQEVCRATFESATAQLAEQGMQVGQKLQTPLERSVYSRCIELRVVQNLRALKEPRIVHRATPV